MSFHSQKEVGFTMFTARSRRYPTVKFTDADYVNNLAITSDHLKDAKMLLQQLQKTTDEIELFVKAKKTEFIYYNQVHSGYIKSLKNENIKAELEFTYLGSNNASTKREVDRRPALNKL